MKLFSLVVVACLAISTTVDAAGVLVKHKGAKSVPGKYIVMLKSNVTSDKVFENKVNELSHRHRNLGLAERSLRKHPKIVQHYKNLHGFTIEDGDDDLQELLDMDDVEYIEEDVELHAMATQNSPPSYGLGRISQRNSVNGQRYPFRYPDQAGAGITAYVVDSGINVQHVEFQGRARAGANFIRGSRNTDENGHGTHVAGTIGSRTYGVAKRVNLVSVKVLDHNNRGYTSGFVAGLDWVIRDARGKRAVVNMSLGGPATRSVNDAVERAYRANIPVFVAAGNEPWVNACNTSPASARYAFTVNSVDRYDNIARASSHGPCVDIFAPGDGILSTYIGNSRATSYLSGTSMATPHVTGAAAVYMSVDGNLRTAGQVYDKLLATGTPNKVRGSLNGSPNLMLYLG